MKVERPLIADFTEAQHDHTSAAQGGLIGQRKLIMGAEVFVLEDLATFMVWTIPFPIRLKAGLPESCGVVEVPFDSDKTMTIIKRTAAGSETVCGTVGIATAATSVTFEFLSDVDFDAGDAVKIVQPATAPTIGGGLSVTLVGDLI